MHPQSRTLARDVYDIVYMFDYYYVFLPVIHIWYLHVYTNKMHMCTNIARLAHVHITGNTAAARTRGDGHQGAHNGTGDYGAKAAG